jgi:glutamate/aspartate transport system substrate-binding protein
MFALGATALGATALGATALGGTAPGGTAWGGTAWGGTAWAEDSLLTGTLKTIEQRGTMLIGVRSSSIPFSFRNKADQPIGFSVDICHGIAADVAAALNVDLLEPNAPSWQKGVRIVYISVASDERLPKVISGEVDLECGSTTATDVRAKSVAFSPIFFLAGTKLMVRRDGAIASYRDLGGKVVAVSAGTTNGEVMKRLAPRVTPRYSVVETPDLSAAYDMLAEDKAAAFASDDILLSGLLATKPDGKQFRVIGDYLSYEPYAIVLRRDDPDFSDLVKRSFERMAAEGTLHALYNRWLTQPLPTGENLNLPISPHLAEMYRALGEPD